MDDALKNRLILALTVAAGSARSSEAQTEALALVSILEAMDAMSDGSPVPTPVAVAHDELRQSVQESTAQAEADAYAKVNAPTETP
jgi:hypothetical protein